MDSIERILNMDFSYPGINIKVEISVIGEYLKEMEGGISAVCDSYVAREEENYRGLPHYEYQHIYMIAEQEIPRVIRLPFMVTLYTLFENSFLQLLKYAQEKEGKQIGVKDIRGKTLVSSYNKYMQHILGYDFCIDQKSMKQFSEITAIRNCIAHSNGNIDSMAQGVLNELTGIIDQNDGLGNINGQLDVSSVYLEQTYEFVSSQIKDLMEYMEKRYFDRT
ncbi:hypothetical protein [Shewanella algae]|uniref:hypothetical protein n=1 Tax=Shewanella algae TaxID=38313 RepID=UPI0016429C15|nr:hypothetical protein [Shewanella algae]